MTGKGYRGIMLAVMSVCGVHAFGLFGYYIFCCAADVSFDAGSLFTFDGVLVLTGYLVPVVMSLVMYVDSRRGRRANWVTVAALCGSVIFAGSMTGDLIAYYFRAGSVYGDAYRFVCAYRFNIYYIPVVFAPLFIWLMARTRRRLSLRTNILETDTRSDRTFKKMEVLFCSLNYFISLVLLIGALISLVTGGGWGALAAMLWSYLCFIPLLIAYIIWWGMFRMTVAKRDEGSITVLKTCGAAEQEKGENDVG